ncbi:MAG TPA: ATP-binding cassette domain-containing protein [Acidimicrobiales bacterium]|nr:ATP-binding cassette domain-containing protein [Acidimicrobiales bacterium]
MGEISVRGIQVNFGGVRALSGVDMDVPAGQVTGLIGPNGAGKTTLFNVVTGLQPPASGSVLLDGRDITSLKPHRRARLGIARTFQRLEVFGTLTARENVLMAAETQRVKLGAGVNPATAADALLERVGVAHVADEPTDLLPTGLARLVELARALATSPTVLLLDEPSSGLDGHETEELGRVLTSLAADGMAILLVEHDMHLVMSTCERVTVLDFGQVIASGPAASVQSDPLVQAAYLGVGDANATADPEAPKATAGAAARKPAASPRAAASPATATPDTAGPNGSAPVPAGAAPALELVDIHAGYGRIEVVHGVNLAVEHGAVFALLGPNGAGKSTLLKVASGRMAPDHGSVLLDGREVTRVSAVRLARRGLCTIPEGRAVFPNLTVAENLLMYTYRARSLRARDLEQKAYERFPVLGERRRQLAGTLSGGEQQMLAIARALCTEPQILLLDEMSMGLAPIVVGRLYEAVADLVAREHLAVLVVEQFAETALTVADRAAIMVNGRIEHTGSPAEVGEHVVQAYMGAPA